jgi:hypothetical protein
LLEDLAIANKEQHSMTRIPALSFVLATLVLAPGIAVAVDDDDPGEGDGGGGGGPPPPPPPPGYWSKTYNHGNYWGTTNWGAGYNLSGSLTATPKQSATTKDKLTASAQARAYAKLDGTSYSMLEVRASGTTQAKGRTDFTLGLYVGGATIYTKQWESTTSTYTFLNQTPIDWQKTFIDESLSIWVGPVPVTFTGKATGRIKATINGKISNVGIEANAGPAGNASFYGSAAIGGEYCAWGVCVGASAGFYGSVDLIDVKVPSEAAVWWSLATPNVGVKLNYKLKSSLDVETLSGEFGVFAEVSLGGTLRWDSTLFDWNGLTYHYALLNISGTHCLSGTCTVIPPPGGGGYEMGP